MISLDEGFQRLLKKWEQYEDTHIKIIDTSIFNWFRCYGLKVIKSYCDGEDIKFTYDIADDGITVEITSKTLLLSEWDTEMLRVFQIAATTFIKANSDGTVTMNLWFRGWKWKDK